MSAERISVLFVCLGNICRSPLAEGVFRHFARERGVEDCFDIDSAGTSGYHAGDPPDSRSVATARSRGIRVEGRSRQLRAADLQRFDYIVVMDDDNLRGAERLASGLTDARAQLHLLREWDTQGTGLGVPDPYSGGAQGFAEVQDIVERSCDRLLDHLLREYPTRCRGGG
ncbi:MAG: low molecular weight phosphotyrosine protein phosphatase [Gemmatimonadota bacterium]|jgi:protein-tyrosine phosphatase|nr:low molecular weight phosphotyrosine protein phosphatase [Gemmatimonadota bacterium]